MNIVTPFMVRGQVDRKRRTGRHYDAVSSVRAYFTKDYLSPLPTHRQRGGRQRHLTLRSSGGGLPYAVWRAWTLVRASAGSFAGAGTGTFSATASCTMFYPCCLTLRQHASALR